MGTPDFRLAALLWLAAMAALAAVIGWETDWGRHVTPLHETPVTRSAPVTVALLPDYALSGATEARRETVERPAFVPTRRPAPPPPAVEPPKPKIQRGQFVLTGTAMVDKEAIAFLREAATGKSRTVRKGDNVNGLTVSTIAPDSIVLALGDETEPLSLKVAPGPRTTIQPPQPGAALPTAAAAAAAAPGQPVPPAAAAGQPADGMSLLERRRAARAAQAAAEAAARGGAAPAASVPAAAPAAPAPVPAAPQGAPAAAAGEEGWAEVYRRMQQPRR